MPAPRPEGERSLPVAAKKIDWSRVAEIALWIAFWAVRIALEV
jgi:hypothetical protein